MSINITGKHIEVGESLSTHIESGIAAITQRYFGDPIEAHVVVTKQSHQFLVDLSVHVSRHLVVHTHGENTDAYRAFDSAAERLENRIRRYKGRLRERKRNHHDDEIAVLSAQQYVVNSEADDEGHDTPLVIAEMSTTVPTLTVGEAVMRMDLSENHVMMFKNSKHGGLNVVYKRNDGHIGWIDPHIHDKK